MQTHSGDPDPVFQCYILLHMILVCTVCTRSLDKRYKKLYLKWVFNFTIIKHLLIAIKAILPTNKVPISGIHDNNWLKLLILKQFDRNVPCDAYNQNYTNYSVLLNKMAPDWQSRPSYMAQGLLFCKVST